MEESWTTQECGVEVATRCGICRVAGSVVNQLFVTGLAAVDHRQLAHHPACHPTYPTPRCHLNSTLLCCPALRHFDQPTASENGHGISTHLCPYSSTLQLYSLVLSLTLSNLTTTMCAAMPSQTNPTPAPIPPQPRHTLHTLCLHAMCRPIAHHEIVQDRLRLDSTAASPGRVAISPGLSHGGQSGGTWPGGTACEACVSAVGLVGAAGKCRVEEC